MGRLIVFPLLYIFCFLSHCIYIFLIFSKGLLNLLNHYYYIYPYDILVNNTDKNYPLLDIDSNFVFSELSKDYDYDYLLKHSTKDKCENGFKKCGILDSYDNIMCLKEGEPCPINEIIIDNETKEIEYIEKGFKSVKLDKILQDYQLLYYTNKSINNSIAVNLCLYNDKYITCSFNKTISNFMNNERVKSVKSIDKYGIEKIYNNSNNSNNSNLSYINYEDYIKYDDNYYDTNYNKVFNTLTDVFIENYIGFDTYYNFKTFMKTDFYKEYPNLVSFIFSMVVFFFTLFYFDSRTPNRIFFYI